MAFCGVPVKSWGRQRAYVIPQFISMGVFALLMMAVPGIVATSLFGITLVGDGGVISALPAGAELPVIETSSFVDAMVSGMLVGRKVSRRLQAWQVQAFRR